MRDVAYWPRSFLNEVEASLVGETPVLWALGGPSFLYRTPVTTIWIDPYFAGTPDDAVSGAYRATAIPIDPAEVRLADALISTHDHLDHCHDGTLLPILSNTDGVCVAPESSARLMRAWGIPDGRIHQVAPGDQLSIGDVELGVFPAYDPNEPSAVTFVLRSRGVSLFVSGDTGQGPALGEIGSQQDLDYALLAFGRTWYMDEQQLIDAARELRTRCVLPFHWEFWRNHTGDVRRLFEIYFGERPPFELNVLLVGDSLPLMPTSPQARA